MSEPSSAPLEPGLVIPLAPWTAELRAEAVRDLAAIFLADLVQSPGGLDHHVIEALRRVDLLQSKASPSALDARKPSRGRRDGLA